MLILKVSEIFILPMGLKVSLFNCHNLPLLDIVYNACYSVRLTIDPVIIHNVFPFIPDE